jgi:hypothetical protein
MIHCLEQMNLSSNNGVLISRYVIYIYRRKYDFEMNACYQMHIK